MLLNPFAQAAVNRVGSAPRATKFNFLKPKPVKNQAGGNTQNWVVVAGGPYPCTVSRHTRKPDEMAQGGQMTSVSQFKMRYSSSLPKASPKYRVALVNGPIYDIKGIDAGRTDPLQFVIDMDLVI